MELLVTLILTTPLLGIGLVTIFNKRCGFIGCKPKNNKANSTVCTRCNGWMIHMGF